MQFYSHLSDDERDQIAILRAAGRSMGAIARALGRAKTTISRELQRNALPSGGYSRFTPPEPINCAGGVKRSSNEKPLYACSWDRLAEGWTPEQISGWLKSGNEPRLRAIGCETIYAFIYRTGQKAEALWRYLTRRHKRRRPRHARHSRDAIKDRASIHDRPKTIESRSEAGHCTPADTITWGVEIGRGHRPPRLPIPRICLTANRVRHASVEDSLHQFGRHQERSHYGQQICEIGSRRMHEFEPLVDHRQVRQREGQRRSPERESRYGYRQAGHMTAIAKETSPKKELAKGPSTYGRGCAAARAAMAGTKTSGAGGL